MNNITIVDFRIRVEINGEVCSIAPGSWSRGASGDKNCLGVALWNGEIKSKNSGISWKNVRDITQEEFDLIMRKMIEEYREVCKSKE